MNAVLAALAQLDREVIALSAGRESLRDLTGILDRAECEATACRQPHASRCLPAQVLFVTHLLVLSRFIFLFGVIAEKVVQLLD
jgi:hypothetical protein